MKPARLGMLVSGSGRHLRNILELERSGHLPVRTVLVISSRAGVQALQHARDFGVPARVLAPEAVTGALEEAGADLAVLAGYLRRWPIPTRWVGRAVNIHPALLPGFGGRGYYGDKVHRAVLEAGREITGCTVHFVTPGYDEGPAIARREVPVLPGDDVRSLAARVFEEERALLPRVVDALARGTVRYEGGRVVKEEEI